MQAQMLTLLPVSKAPADVGRDAIVSAVCMQPCTPTGVEIER